MRFEVPFGSTSPGLFAGLIEAYVYAGCQGALRERDPDWQEGILNGLEACEDMKDADVIDFELASMHLGELDKKNNVLFHTGQMPLADYIRHEQAWFRVKHCFEILQVAHYVLYDEAYGNRYRSLKDRPPMFAHQTLEDYHYLAAEAGLPQL